MLRDVLSVSGDAGGVRVRIAQDAQATELLTNNLLSFPVNVKSKSRRYRLNSCTTCFC